MIYSRWRPDRGGYDYFESRERFGMGDDLPTPDLSGGTSIGISSVSAGRIPSTGQLVPVGSGKEARGMVMPTSRAGLQGLGFLDSISSWTALALGVVAGALGYHAWKERKG